jgi:hypothetical protein
VADNIKDIAVKETKEPQIRLLVCRNCRSAEELPDWDGRPEDDVLLQITVERHQRPTPHVGLLFKFPVKYWARPDVKQQILKQISEGSSGLDVFGTKFYDTKSTFQEDAMKCYALHNRPTGQCPDYKSDRKMLKPDTAKERKEAGMDKESKGPKIYLCDFCPVKSFNMKKHNEQKGMYQ